MMMGFTDILPGVLLASTLFNSCLAASTVPSRISRRIHARDPAPSAYPGSGTAFTNEWRYVNFDMTKDIDKKNVEIIHNAFDGMRRLALAGIVSAVGNDPVYKRWFDGDDDDERTGEVLVALRLIVPEKNADGSPNSKADVGPLIAGSIVVDNIEFVLNEPNPPKCDGKTFAYTDATTGRMHFCQLGLDLTDAGALSCSSNLDPFVSTKMDNTGRLALHEATHVNNIFQARLGSSIVDTNNQDGNVAYGPERAHALLSEDPGKVTANADNYAWLACNAFMAQKHCPQGDFNDPQGYE